MNISYYLFLELAVVNNLKIQTFILDANIKKSLKHFKNGYNLYLVLYFVDIK